MSIMAAAWPLSLLRAGREGAAIGMAFVTKADFFEIVNGHIRLMYPAWLKECVTRGK